MHAQSDSSAQPHLTAHLEPPSMAAQSNGTAPSVDVVLDKAKMYTVEWRDGNTFGFTLSPVKSDHGPVLLVTRRTTRRSLLQSVGLEAVVPGDMLVAIGDEKVYQLGAENATDFLRCVRKPVKLLFQLSPYGAAAKNLPALAPNEFNYLWETGSLGIVFNADDKLNVPVVKRLKIPSENAEALKHVAVGDQLIYVNDIATCEYSMSKIMDIIKGLPKPILLRFRKDISESHKREVPELATDEYDFLWEYGALGLVLSESQHGYPGVRSITGKGTSKQLSLVQVDDEIIMVNDRPAKRYEFHGIMDYLTNVPKPAVIRFRRPRGGRGSNNAVSRPSTAGAPPPGALNHDRRSVSARPPPTARLSMAAPNDGKKNGNTRLTRAMTSLAEDNQRREDNRSSLPTDWPDDGLNGYDLNRHGNRQRGLGQKDSPSGSFSSNEQPQRHGSHSSNGSSNDGPVGARDSYHVVRPSMMPSNQVGVSNRSNSSDFNVPVPGETFFMINTSAFYHIQWTDGPFGLTVREGDSDRGAVMLITKRTGRDTCPGLRRVAVGDILVQIGEKRVSQLGFDQGTRYLKTVPKPVMLVFQAID
ncbi:TPA: hypothetical protein N0F65_010477 [Lagenidium giganteum]|uniref:PDZ domain-containing protein n=1 Tax=Lagenidium giganteum TaxID=4803 RepID=A0AAV2ZB94_9STRA|nr:TPA: hypothetical protein N0F65_010477 [Lagenidium giganteum]